MPTKPFFVVPLDLGTITAGNETAGYAASNLNRQKEIGLTWKSAGSGNLYVRGNFGMRKAVDFCSLVSANASAGTRIRLRLGDTQAEVDGTADYDSGALPFINPGIIREDGLYHSHLEIPSVQTKPWWRIDINEAAPENLLSYSNDFTNAVWKKPGFTITPGNTTGPDGVTMSGTKVESVAGDTLLTREITATSTTAVFKVIAKPGPGMTTADDPGNQLAFMGLDGNGGFNSSRVALGNGWYEYTMTATSGIVVGDPLTLYWGATSGVTPGKYFWIERAEYFDRIPNTGNFQAANLILGSKITPTRYYNQDFEFGVRDMGDLTFNRWGVADENPGIIMRSIGFTLGWVTELEYETSFRPMLEKLGKRGIVYFCFDPTPNAYRQSRSYLGVLDKLPFSTGKKKAGVFSQDYTILSMI